MKAQYLFQPGIWWVYRDTISLVVDSVVVESVDHGFYRDMDQAGRYDPWHDREYFEHVVRIYRLAGPPLDNPPVRHFGYTVGAQYLFGFPFPFKDTYGAYCMLPEIKLDSNTFRNVDVFIHDAQADTFQMAVPGIGIVMLQQDSIYSWPGYGDEFYYKLVRWHVVQ